MSRPFPAVTTGKPTILKRQAFINTDRRRSKIQTGDMGAPPWQGLLYLTSPRPRPTRPRVPYLMSSSPSSRVPSLKSQVPTHASCCPRPLVPVPLLYPATTIPSSRCLTPLGRTHISKNVRFENIHVLRKMLLTGSSCKLIGKLVVQSMSPLLSFTIN